MSRFSRRESQKDWRYPASTALWDTSKTKRIPGDSRTKVGFLTFDSTIHFYNLQEGLSQPQMLVVSDIDDVFIPSHDSLMVNLKESKELVKELLRALPSMFGCSTETQSALGPALQAAFKLMSPTGGRVSVFQTQLPTAGAGRLQSREDPNQRSSTKETPYIEEADLGVLLVPGLAVGVVGGGGVTEGGGARLVGRRHAMVTIVTVGRRRAAQVTGGGQGIWTGDISALKNGSDPGSSAPPYGNYGYHGVAAPYQTGPAPLCDSSPSHDAYGQPGYQQYAQPFPSLTQLSAALGGLSGVPELESEALRPVDLLQERNLLPPRPLEPPEPNLSPELRKVNCSLQTFRCTLTSIPQTQALLNKARLPLGLLLHPFRDLQQLPVITSNTIVRCRSCRTYINPFVTFLDQRRWKCNLCYRINDGTTFLPLYLFISLLTHWLPKTYIEGVQHLGPATDFYKKLALDCSGQQIGVDLFLLSSQYADLSSLACISKYSAGSVFYYPSFHHSLNPAQLDKFQRDLERYLTRKIGFEAVMRIRCTKGLSIHTFHGNFFVRSTDLLSLANVNPDSAFAVQMSIEDSLADSSLACFQAALLYTSSKGKRRIRVHTLCLPVVGQLSDVYAGADVQAITCLLANMAIDRSVSSSLSDARDALVNAVVDFVSSYRSNVSQMQPAGLLLPAAMRLFPLYVLALLKQSVILWAAGGDTSSSTTGSASPVPNSYDSLEGGSYPGTYLSHFSFHHQQM
ncbi:unnamed protein product [Menidia menidia]|uniref:(Atlantic silverside) hypothetical protein n=1 Tax=Menidia menidia TaxID=238744 RepID=A0A8S4BRT9_9TELE|nr:unnamed protein product [Menidia menidia]